MPQPIRWGIIGPGRIAHSFAKDLRLVPEGILTAVASRNLGSAKAFAEEYGAGRAFGSYAELMDSDLVDVVYIATPHTSHAELAIMAMDKGKHVLCEKPMGIDKGQVQRMVEAANRNKVFLMEALWSRFNPTIMRIKKLVDERHIGPISYIQADFAFYALDRDEKGRLLNLELAGGSLLDIGIYPIFLAYLMLGRPDGITASSRFHTTGAEIQTSMIFEYPRAQAMLYSGLNSKSDMRAQITGSGGSIYIHPRWHEAHGFSLEKEGVLEDFELPPIGKGYAHEIMEIHRCLKTGKIQSELWSHGNSLDLIGIMDEVRRKTGIRFPMEG